VDSVANTWYQIHQSCDALDDHEHYTRRQKKFGAMEPNLKILLEDLMQQVRDDIKKSQEELLNCFGSYTNIIDTRISEFAMMEQMRGDRVAALELATATFNSSFDEWKPQVNDLIHSVKLELSKLNTYFNRDAKESSTSKAGVLAIELAQERPMPGSAAASPKGHRVDNYHWDCGYGEVYTHIHDLVKGTIPHAPLPPNP
jgi:hypothetical protein